MSQKLFYMVYDGRAVYDVDAASVMEAMGEYTDEKAAIADYEAQWGEFDAVLYAYEQEGDCLINGRMVACPSW